MSRKQRKSNVTINDVVSLVSAKNGICLTSHYTNCRRKLLVQCQNGHRWHTTYTRLRLGQWCPYCTNRYIREDQCRYIFEHLLNTPFPKDHTVLGSRLHLDGYSSCLGIAFEYDGEQHFSFTSMWHKTHEVFIKQQQRDCKKSELCTQIGIKLIRIPYYAPDIVEFIKNKLIEFNIKFVDTNIDWKDFWKNNNKILEKCQQFAQSKNGQLLSNCYPGSRVKLMWKCQHGHTWKASWNSVKFGSWCSKCDTNRRKHTIQQMQAIATSRGGQCLSAEYLNKRTKLLWACSMEHIWTARPQDVMKGSWCPRCARIRSPRDD